MNRDKLEVYVNPHNMLTRIKILEQGQKRVNNYFNINNGNIQGGQEGSQQGKTNSPGLDTTDINATYSTDFTQDGILRFKITIQVTAGKVRGFMGYAYRIYGWSGDVQEYKNYVNPDTLGFTDFSTFYKSVSSGDTSQTINVSVKALNSVYGDSEWSGLVPVVLAKDTTAPATPSAPTVNSKAGSIIVTFSVATEPDYDFTEIWVGSGSSFTTSTGAKVGQSKTGVFFWIWDNVIDVANNYDYVKLRHLDKSGNASILSNGTNITSGLKTGTLQVTGTIADTAITTSKLAALAVTSAKIANNAVGNVQLGIITDATRILPDIESAFFKFTDALGNIRGQLGYSSITNAIALESLLTPIATGLNIKSNTDLNISAIGGVIITSGAGGGTTILGGNVNISTSVTLGQHGGVTDTTGYVYISDVSGVPTGVPAGYSSYLALVWDSTGKNIYYYDSSWKKLTTGGSVTSVGLSLPAELTVSGSPVTSSGTLSATWATVTANKVFAGPAVGGSGTPGFRVLAATDIPSLSYVPLSTVTTKGDLVVASGSAAVSRFPVGAAAGMVIISDNTQTLGMRYVWPNSVMLTNASGGTVNLGDVVIINKTSDASFTTTTTANAQSLYIGVVQDTILNGAIGLVTISGYTPQVNLTGATTRGNYLFTSTTAKQATTNANDAAGSFGQVLGTSTTPPAVLWNHPSQSPFAHASTHVTGGSDVIANVVAAGNSGLMTGSDKTKLDSMASGASVSSVAMTVPGELSISGSPITGSGTLALTWATEIANRVFAGPASIGPSTPTFRTLVSADIPSLSSLYIALSTFTTKGDLVAATGSGAISRLGSGANNTILTSSSLTSTGLAWNNVINMAGNGNVLGDTDIIGTVTTNVTLTVNAAAGQGVNIQNWSTSTGTVLSGIDKTGSFMFGTNKVVGARQTGWALPTGSISRATYATSTVTLATLAGYVMALATDLSTHGLIGT